ETDKSTIVIASPYHEPHGQTSYGTSTNKWGDVVERYVSLHGECLHNYYEHGELIRGTQWRPWGAWRTSGRPGGDEEGWHWVKPRHTPTPDAVDDSHVPKQIRLDKAPPSLNE